MDIWGQLSIARKFEKGYFFLWQDNSYTTCNETLCELLTRGTIITKNGGQLFQGLLVIHSYSCYLAIHNEVADNDESSASQTMKSVMDALSVKQEVTTYLLYHLPCNESNIRKIKDHIRYS